MRKSSIFAAAALLACVGFASVSQAQLASDLYRTQCASCHGIYGKGQTPMGRKLKVPDFQSPAVANASDGTLFLMIKSGKNKMPRYNGKLTDDQIKELVKYIRSLE